MVTRARPFRNCAQGFAKEGSSTRFFIRMYATGAQAQVANPPAPRGLGPPWGGVPAGAGPMGGAPGLWPQGGAGGMGPSGGGGPYMLQGGPPMQAQMLQRGMTVEVAAAKAVAEVDRELQNQQQQVQVQVLPQVPAQLQQQQVAHTRELAQRVLGHGHWPPQPQQPQPQPQVGPNTSSSHISQGSMDGGLVRMPTFHQSVQAAYGSNHRHSVQSMGSQQASEPQLAFHLDAGLAELAGYGNVGSAPSTPKASGPLPTLPAPQAAVLPLLGGTAQAPAMLGISSGAHAQASEGLSGARYASVSQLSQYSAANMSQTGMSQTGMSQAGMSQAGVSQAAQSGGTSTSQLGGAKRVPSVRFQERPEIIAADQRPRFRYTGSPRPNSNQPLTTVGGVQGFVPSPSFGTVAQPMSWESIVRTAALKRSLAKIKTQGARRVLNSLFGSGVAGPLMGGQQAAQQHQQQAQQQAAAALAPGPSGASVTQQPTSFRPSPLAQVGWPSPAAKAQPTVQGPGGASQRQPAQQQEQGRAGGRAARMSDTGMLSFKPPVLEEGDRPTPRRLSDGSMALAMPGWGPAQQAQHQGQQVAPEPSQGGIILESLTRDLIIDDVAPLTGQALAKSRWQMLAAITMAGQLPALYAQVSCCRGDTPCALCVPRLGVHAGCHACLPCAVAPLCPGCVVGRTALSMVACLRPATYKGVDLLLSTAAGRGGDGNGECQPAQHHTADAHPQPGRHLGP